jgi:lysophospholipase L1-like esterase
MHLRHWVTALSVIAVTFAGAGSAVAAKPDKGGGGGGKTSTEKVVALGDSYASGNGTGSADLNWSCYRSSRAYPALLDDARPNTSVDFKACSGATTSTVRSSQLGSLSRSTAYVTLSVGGNDIGFTDLILNCIGSYDQAQCLSTVDTVSGRITDELPAKLDATYADITNRAPKAELIVVGYPRPFGDNVSCSQANGIDATEAAALNGVTEQLDAAIAARVAAAGATYVSVIDGFTGHDVCASTPYLVGRYAWDYRDIYHPTRAGHAEGFLPLVMAEMN